ncbi:M15 family metallopeptidase [Nocardioides sp. SYSU D00065]|uniref:M15 family metallopeptidase n=1 Tax=Nocardioides sp. SYSU D00065 TaxID=2817378 RepID=UPI001B33CDD3|nr:M15 family metallopeptidase [Nocardioides sp. SYSU D00065]
MDTTRRSARLVAALLVLTLTLLACRAAERDPATPRPAASPGTGPPADPGIDPSVAGLDPELRAAVRAATRDAERDGVRLVVTSGWRSRAHQERLFAEAVESYGSEEEARRWVALPDESAHVTGDAVDIGPTDGAYWLGQHGAAYGLCQTYANEPWHFELLTAPGGTCPEMLPDGSSAR